MTSSIYFSWLKKVLNSRENLFVMRLNAWNRPLVSVLANSSASDLNTSPNSMLAVTFQATVVGAGRRSLDVELFPRSWSAELREWPALGCAASWPLRDLRPSVTEALCF